MNADQMASRAWKEKCELLEGENKVFKEELAVQMKENERLFVMAGRTVHARRWVERTAFALFIVTMLLISVSIAYYQQCERVVNMQVSLDRAWALSMKRDELMKDQMSLLMHKKSRNYKWVKR